MDGVEYAPFEDRLKTGQMLLELARTACRAGSHAAAGPRCNGSENRAGGGSVALAYGWVATQDWLIRIFDLQEMDPAEIDTQLEAILMSIADLIFPPAEDSQCPES